MRRSVVAVLVASIAVGSHAPALAQEDPETLIKQGLDLRRRGDPERAYGYFKRAYDLGNTPRAAAQLGLVECSLRNFLDSERHLSEALAAKDPWVEKYRGLLEDTRKKARAPLARVEIRGVPAGGTVTVGKDVPRPLRGDGIVYALPGQIALTIAAVGQRVEKTVSAQPGETVAIDAGLATPRPPATEPERAAPAPATSPPPPPALPERSGGNPPPVAQLEAHPTPKAAGRSLGGKEIAGIATGVAGIGLGTSGYFVYRAGAKKLDHINSGGTYDPADGNWKTLADLGIGMMVGGAVALGAGGWLYWWGHNQAPAPTDTRATNVAVSPTGDGWRLQISGTF